MIYSVRLGIPPFNQARKVIEPLLAEKDNETETKVKAEPDSKVKTEITDTEDILSMCHTVAMEVVELSEF